MNFTTKIVMAALLAAGLMVSTSAFAQTVGEPPEEEEAVETEEAAPSPGSRRVADEEAADEDTEEAAPTSRRVADEEAAGDDEPAEQDTGAAAEVEVASDHPAANNSIVLAPHVGVLFPQLTSDLGTWPIFGLSAGYILPFDAVGFTRPLELGFDVMYSQPGADGSGTDPNLGDAGADYEWELTQRMLIMEIYAIWRFMPPGEFISAYGHIGPRAYFMESETQATGNDGQDFGTNTQTNDEYGLVFGGGADFAVGPGTIYCALEFGWSDLNQRTTGDSNTGALTLDAGYRLYF